MPSPQRGSSGLTPRHKPPRERWESPAAARGEGTRRGDLRGELAGAVGKGALCVNVGGKEAAKFCTLV